VHVVPGNMDAVRVVARLRQECEEAGS
jgi:hypothetical protein